MPFTEPLLKAMNDPGSPMNPQNFAKQIEGMHLTPMDFVTALLQQSGGGTTGHDMEVFEAQPDHVIHAEAEAYGTMDDENGLHDVNATHHDDTIQATHNDSGTYDAYALHDDAGFTGA